jgi:hypothetical protein
MRELWLSRLRFAADPRQMIARKRAQDVHDVAAEIDQHGEQRSELGNGDGRGGLFGLKCFVGAALKIYEASSEDKMSG